MADRAVPPRDIAPHDFFTRWVPDAVEGDARRRERLATTRAVLEFHLLDTESEVGGVFVLHVEEGLVRGRPGAAAEADLRVRLDVGTWRALNEGSLSAPEAFLRRRVQLRGDLRLAVMLHFLIG
jgi:putative sterol carrier protein